MENTMFRQTFDKPCNIVLLCYQQENDHLDLDCNMQAEIAQPPIRPAEVEDGDTVSENLTSEMKVEEAPIENEK